MSQYSTTCTPKHCIKYKPEQLEVFRKFPATKVFEDVYDRLSVLSADFECFWRNLIFLLSEFHHNDAFTAVPFVFSRLQWGFSVNFLGVWYFLMNVTMCTLCTF